MNVEVAEIVPMMGTCSASAGPHSPAEAAEHVMDAVEWLEAEELLATVL